MGKIPVTALVILDGWGHREEGKDNAIFEAKIPFFDHLMSEYPHSLLMAAEEAVGLTLGTMGNSEVGHKTIGSGRVIHTDLLRIKNSIEIGEYKKTGAFHELFRHVRINDSTLHVMGLLSYSGVHSHQEHLHEFLRLAKEEGVQKIAIHAFTDGRDSPPTSGAEYLRDLEGVLADIGIGHIATISGRYYAMDRDKNWHRTEMVERALFENGNEGKNMEKHSATPSEVLQMFYEKGHEDEHIEPVIFLDSGGREYKIDQNDGVFFFNFRNDRARQLAQRIYERGKDKNILFVTMTEYSRDIDAKPAFGRLQIKNTLADVVSNAGLSQAHIAETEKYAHVTYFFNGESGERHEGEEHVLLESRKDVRTHDLAPEMRAKEITDAAIEKINEETNFLVINYANADMVGHTGNKEATIKAVEFLDKELRRLHQAMDSKGGILCITADHGNAEVSRDTFTGDRHTAHTTSRVPFIITKKGIRLEDGTLADVAPTVLALMGLRVPKEMTGNKLFN